MRRSVTRLLLFLALCLTAPFFAGAAHAAAPTWTPQLGFLNNAIIAGDIKLDGVKVSAANSLLGAFGPGGESDCRAVSNVPFDGNFSYFLVIGSDTAQTITFKYYDSGLDAVIDITEPYAFVADDYQGALTLNATSADTDEDTIPDYADNCVDDANTDQADADSDGIGDVCDPDDDNDGVADTADQCQGYDDNDDADSDNIPDECDECPSDANNDADSDTVCGDVDNCPADANTDQADSDGDNIGDVCDACPADAANDADSDTVCGNVDNCPATANTDQADADIDGLGDVCDPDDDNDGVADTSDLCPGFDDAADADGDDLPDGCDTCPNDPYNDADSDTICGNVDNCPDDANTDQADGDSDDIGNVCDTCPNDADNDADSDGVCGDVDECPGYDDAADADNDTVADGCDNCPDDANTNQLNTDGDDFGDVCDTDDDNDGVLDNAPDNCPLIANADQADSDDNGIGDACDNPIITMNGTDEVLVVGNTYVDAGATVTYQGNTITEVLEPTGTVDTATAGEYTLTYNYTSPGDGRVATTVVRHVTVYDPVEITTEPADTSLASGSAADFAVEGGSESYTWYVNDVEAGTGAAFTFTAPTTAGFAGEYVVKVKDNNNPANNSGLVDTFTVKVPMKITPAAKGITGITPMDLTVTGAGTDYEWEILANAGDEDAVADPTADYGVFDDDTTTDGANTFNPSALDAITTFYVRVTVTGDAGLTAANGLNTVIGGPYSIYPTMAFVGKIVEAADDMGIGGATVTVTAPISAAGTEVTTSNLGNESDGEFTIQLPNTGAAYQFEATADGYVPKAFTSDNLTSDVAGENLVRMTASDGVLRIQGVVTQDEAAPTVEVKVVAYDADGVAAGSTVVAAGGDDYTIFLSADNGPYSVVASIPGYVNARATGIDLPDLGVNLNVTTLLTGVVNTATVTSAVIASPAAGSSLPTRTMGGLAVSPVVIPAGSVADTVTTVTVTYTQVPVATGGAAFVIEAMDGATEVTFDSPIIINMPYDSGAITPDDILNGDYVIYHAPDQDDLEAGTNLETVPVDDIISIDIGDGVEGIITFRVSHLSAFAIKKAAAAAPALGDSSSDPRCFIATAAFGSPFEAHVTTLRRFRDAVLLQSSVGRSFVRAYYRLSPPMANFIAGHDTLRTVARAALLPAVGMSYMVLNLGLLWSLAALAGSLLLSCLLVGVARKKND